MKKLAGELSKVISNLDGDAGKFMRIARNNDCYKQAVNTIWNKNAACLILENTNAVYIREDPAPRKGPDKDKPYIVCEVCSQDSMVRSELDTHRELLHLELRKLGLNFEELRIKPSRGAMRSRHPFKAKN
ncbi:hypothetical protein [Adlercreutzia sp. ZJ154]|uniref:hypothetical protein n=1 Tax=Adlercreutzia sp. ZJ154 TaxID=2709790 RepID=UPI0013EC5177|nr:hypothetical protein [Adlercreutzia sp. ZJ154]